MSSHNATTTTAGGAGGGASHGAAGGAPGGAHGPSLEDMLTAKVTIEINAFIYCVIGLIVLLRVPHLVGFLKSNSGRPFLQVFRSGEPSSASEPKNLNQGPKLRKGASFDSTDKGSGPYGAGETVVLDSIHLDAYSTTKCPPHVPSAPGFLDPLRRLLQTRVLPGYSAMQIAVLMNYTYVILYGAFRWSNPFTDGARAGMIAVSQMPLIFALAQKSSILGSLLGYGYETLNYIHRYAGRLSVTAANVHAIFYIYKWSNAGTILQELQHPKFAWGLAFLIAMDILFFFSLEFWRRKAYNIFFWSHTIGIMVLFPAGCMHMPAARPYMFACAILYGLDRIVRAVKSSIATATITHLPRMDMAYVEVPNIRSGWRAGQHVRLRVFSSAMGAFGWAETHPFTIASASGANDGLVLFCKKAGDWTGKLVELAKELDSRGVEGQGTVKVWIEGPFGGPSRMVFSSFSAAVLVVGGSGITFGLSMMEELLVKDRRHESRLKYIELVWVVPDPASVTPLVPLFTSLIQQSHYCILRISIHYTKALTEKVPVYERVEAEPCTSITIDHPNLTLSPGRPRFKNIMNNAIGNAMGLGTAKEALGVSGVVVGVCGPISLGEQVVRSVGEIESATKSRVGGIEIHEETFGW
ncbi:ferric reductase transmembrane component [Ephemerocybe angulata]|uniref:ferric-chelate reductase (NADPH) n=1 Tax=Ephemerocybe angulata TaxID=980116 RepID=A0A8H6I812_9AGAR|nr:ferric reductase transmembrane component [Tulosesus angulatus]